MNTNPVFTLVKTCSAYPEQYDVYVGEEIVGYLRLRHGHFGAFFPNPEGRVVYSAEPEGEGIFKDHERDYYLRQACLAIAKHMAPVNQELFRIVEES